jgi:hypothetical protein
LEWNSDPEIAQVAEHLYGKIDNLELYVGLQAEEAKPVVDGAGLCPGKFISLIHFLFLISSSQGTPSVALFLVTPSHWLVVTGSLPRIVLRSTWLRGALQTVSVIGMAQEMEA